MTLPRFEAAAKGENPLADPSLDVEVEELKGVTVHNSVCLAPLLKFGTMEQIERYAPDLASGRKIGGFTVTEPQAGSRASSAEACAACPAFSATSRTVAFICSMAVAALSRFSAVAVAPWLDCSICRVN